MNRAPITPPMAKFSDMDAEECLVGVVGGLGFERVADLEISPFEFRGEGRERFWMAAADLHAAGKGSTSPAIAAKLGKSTSEIINLGDASAMAASREVLADYAKRLRDCYIRQRVHDVGGELQDGVIEPAAAAEALKAITELGTSDSPESLFANVRELVAGGLDPELPTVAEVLPSNCALYRGRINEIHAEPSVGKTNVALALTKSILEAGGRVLFIDPEDSGKSAVRRLLSFGAEVEHVARGFHHVSSPSPNQWRSLVRWCQKSKPDAVVVDGVAETMASMGLDEDRPAEFLAFVRERLTPFAEAGAAVLVSDHVTKSTEGRGRWARGTGAKLGRYDGAVYSAEIGKAYTPTEAGFVRLKVSKDRNGGVGSIGTLAFELHFAPEDGRTEIEWRKPKAGERFIPTAIMEKISRALEAFPDSTKNDLRRCGKAEYVDQGVGELVAGGFLKSEREGNRLKFQLVKPYREGGENV